MSNNKVLKPPVLMKLKRKRIGNSHRVQSDPYTHVTKHKKNYCHGDEICKRQLMNPFQTTTKKTQNLMEIKENNASTSNDMFSILSKPKSSLVAMDASYVLPNFGSSTAPPNTNNEDEESHKYACLPKDWSLKTEYKIHSRKSLKWCTPSLLKPSEEAQCTASFAALQVMEGSSDRERLRCALSYWMHPNIPWLKLFPRDYPSISKSDGTVLKQEALIGLLNEWTTSFESLFGLLKSRNCPYFYLCSHVTTVMFRLTDEELVADMVPTTYGVRNTLNLEDVEFTMPLAHDLLTSTSADQENQDESEDTGEARDFLDSLGIDSKRYSELDPAVVKLRAAGRLKLDHSIRSLVRVCGRHVQGLFNYLLNNKSIVPTVGEFSGIPPTLLSPTVFVGATIRHNQVKCGSSHARQVDGGMELIHYLHIAGPLLPSSLENVNDLLARAQEEFSGKLSSLQNSTAYNCQIVSPDIPSTGPQDNPSTGPPDNTYTGLPDNTSTCSPDNTDSSVVEGEHEKSVASVATTSMEQKELNSTIYDIQYEDGCYSYK